MSRADIGDRLNLADDLALIASEVAVHRAALDSVTERLVNCLNEGRRSELRREQGTLMAACLSYRLALLYKIEEHWPEVLTAIRAAASTATATK